MNVDQAPPLSPSARLVLERLDYLEEAWPLLVERGVDPSNMRRVSSAWRLLPDEAAERAAREARAEIAERRRPGWVRVDSHPKIPLDVDMLDLIAAVVSTAEDLAETITQVAGTDRPRYVESIWDDPRPRLRTARAWLTAAQEADAATVPWSESVLVPIVRRVAAALGETVDGQILDALCPWCGGRTAKRPLGGDRTLTVRVREGKPMMIVCEGVACEPPTSACGARVHGQPAWPDREWDWLAKQLKAVQ